MVKDFTFTKAILFAFALSSATTLKSMLQQLDSQISTKDNFLHDQRSKLSEKEKVIINQRSELERLEKRSKTLEYKVLFHFTIFTLFYILCAFCVLTFLHPPFSDRHPAEDYRDVRAGQTHTSAGAGDTGATAAQGAVREEAHGAAHARHGDGRQA